MKYARIDNERIVREILPDFDERFPGIPIDQRYSKEFLNQCLELDDAAVVEQNWEYLPFENIFLQQLEYIGTAFAETEPGQAVEIPVIFSEAGTWTATGAVGIELSEAGGILTVTAQEPGEYSIQIEFCEAAHKRTKTQTITLKIGENVEIPWGGGHNLKEIIIDHQTAEAILKAVDESGEAVIRV